MPQKQFLFYLGGGGNGINFIASLCHYNYYQQKELMKFCPVGSSHPYSIKNHIHTSWAGFPQYETSNFKVVNIDPQSIHNHYVDFLYTYITTNDTTDLKFTFLNHFIKVQSYSIKNKFPFLNDEKLFEHFMDMHQVGDEISNFVVPPEHSSVMFSLKFSDIYQNRKKIITFIEDLTKKKSSEMLHTNYDRYLTIQKQVIKQRAPWAYDRITSNYLP